MDQNAIVNLYLFAFCTVGLALVFGSSKLKRCNFSRPAPGLSFVHVITTLAFIFLDINIVLIPVERKMEVKEIRTTQYVLDAISLPSLGLAYFFSLRHWSTNDKLAPSWLRNLCWPLLFTLIIYPVCDILGIIALWSKDLERKANGNFTTIIMGVWTILFAANDLIMHLLVIIILTKLLKQRETTLERVKIYIAAIALIASSLGLLAGAIYRIFNTDVGITIFYTAWLIQNLIFQWVDRIVHTTEPHSRNSTHQFSNNSTEPSAASMSLDKSDRDHL